MQKGLMAAMLLALVVIGLGAFTRLTDAGLGCPDWPGCYGHFAVPQTEAQLQHAAVHFPERPLERQKAWHEMIHRYFAGALGLLVLALAGCACWRKQQRGIALLVCLLIGFQAILGMLTVTKGLMPLIVMGHLLGGFSVLALLFCWYNRVKYPPAKSRSRIWPLVLGLAILVLQLALGGWTSANYAAISCQGFPLCHEDWQQLYQLKAFDPLPHSPTGNYEFGVLSHPERVTVHVSHRIWAGVTALYWLLLAMSYLLRPSSALERRRASRLLLVLFTQLGLGLANVWWQLPLLVAVAHNLVAALLLLSALSLLLACYQKGGVTAPREKERLYGEVEYPKLV
ncbi:MULTISPECIES: COX15/CtaA family protein [unclassified Agarivorans]|uniref:COX15/CtaA family protein n=1 Tax=unclassified Agarivorans TaxID=2636026 RepID=UPI003D7C95E3